MEVYACGFNAWNQLVFSHHLHEEEPHDTFEFKCILKDEKIEILRAGLSSTLSR
jgi:hypothetical protein